MPTKVVLQAVEVLSAQYNLATHAFIKHDGTGQENTTIEIDSKLVERVNRFQYMGALTVSTRNIKHSAKGGDGSLRDK